MRFAVMRCDQIYCICDSRENALDYLIRATQLLAEVKPVPKLYIKEIED